LNRFTSWSGFRWNKNHKLFYFSEIVHVHYEDSSFNDVFKVIPASSRTAFMFCITFQFLLQSCLTLL
jgi:hypothetical protein